jgi:hypothetical protein
MNPDTRSLMFRSGDAFLPARIRQFLRTYIVGGPTTTFYLNYWSVVHFMSGMLFAAVYHPFLFTSMKPTTELYLAGFLVHTLWELWQIVIGMSRPFLMAGNNNFLDVIIDTILFMAGIRLFIFLRNTV